MPTSTHTKTVIVLGASYGGARAAQVLAEGLPADHRIILIDRNSHANHLYVIPRLGVLPGHEHKAFVPYTNVFYPNTQPQPLHRHLFLQAHVLSLNATSVTLDREFPEHGLQQEIPFDYAVYALGSHLPAPINMWAAPADLEAESERDRKLQSAAGAPVGGERAAYGGTKAEGVRWLQRLQERVAHAGSVLVVGGGALGIQFATDIAAVHPTKQVTLLHSRHRLLPRFDPAMHAEIMKAMDDLHVDVVLGERLDLASTHPDAAQYNKRGQRVVRTEKGRELAADLLLLCTGQIPNTALLGDMDARTVDPASGMAHVLRTMQLGVLPAAGSASGADAGRSALGAAFERLPLEGGDGNGEADDEDDEEPLEATPYPHMFVIGDAADAFDAINAGHNAYYQGEVAARNVIKLAKRGAWERSTPDRTEGNDEDGEVEDDELERYAPNAPAIKVSLGLGKSVYEINGAIGLKDDAAPDLDAGLIWRYFGMGNAREEEMFA